MIFNNNNNNKKAPARKPAHSRPKAQTGCIPFACAARIHTNGMHPVCVLSANDTNGMHTAFFIRPTLLSRNLEYCVSNRFSVAHSDFPNL